jgi:hypothetical protein
MIIYVHSGDLNFGHFPLSNGSTRIGSPLFLTPPEDGFTRWVFLA